MQKDLVIITGLSGAGRTEAIHTFEDLGYYCIDNLPPTMIKPLVELASTDAGLRRSLAVVCDVRSHDFFGEAKKGLEILHSLDLDYQLVFLEAPDEVLRTRYSALRRLHPLMKEFKLSGTRSESTSLTLDEAIAQERRLLAPLRAKAHMVIDTGKMRPRHLKQRLTEQFSVLSDKKQLVLDVFSFGFKYGNPPEADLIIDVRFLPNPFYVPELKKLTGFDKPVADYIFKQEETKRFLEAWKNLLDVVMPGYLAEGKQYLSLGVGCTGGQHRSVVLAEATADYLLECGYDLRVSHRDLHRCKA